MSLDALQTLGPGQSCAVIQNGGASDSSAVHFQRNASGVVGGKPGFTNSALVVEIIVGPADATDEWASLNKLSTAGSGENVGEYTQVEAIGTRQTVWGDCVEIRDNSDGTNALVGRETDLIGGDENSIGHDLVIDNSAATALRVGPPAQKAAQNIASALHVTGNCTKGVVRMKSGQAAVLNEEMNAGFFVGNGFVTLWANGVHLVFDGKQMPYMTQDVPR